MISLIVPSVLMLKGLPVLELLAAYSLLMAKYTISSRRRRSWAFSICAMLCGKWTEYKASRISSSFPSATMSGGSVSPCASGILTAASIFADK